MCNNDYPFICTPKGAEKGSQGLDVTIDFDNGGVPAHLGRISEFLREWEGRIADELGLASADVAAIKMMHPFSLKLQTYGARVDY